jgi:predicted GNAT superfamily acetyltransferase
MNDLQIRPLTTMVEIEQVRHVQMATWGMAPEETIPPHTLHALQHHGALLLGALDGERVVGFAFAVLGTMAAPERVDAVAAARLKLYSVATGLLPGYQQTGAGYRLKLAQRAFANQIGVRLISWTYDPLMSVNGRFNISKLGGIVSTYHRDFHGNMGGVNAGLPTDRFEVEWWVTSQRVKGRGERQQRPLTLASLLAGGAHLLNPTQFNAHGHSIPPDSVDTDGDQTLLLVEIPANFTALKTADFALAQQWRLHTRLIFESLFRNHYIVTDFVQNDDSSQRRSFYLLTRNQT